MVNYLRNLRERRHKRRSEPQTRGEDQRVAVIGLGRFGLSLANELVRRGWDVLGIDTDARLVQKYSDDLTHAAVADCTDAEALRQLGVHEFTSAVVAIGTDIEASILVSSNLLEAEVPNIWAKAISRQHGRILERLGVHHVVLPEHEMGERVAHLVTGRMLDFIEFDDDYALVKTVAPDIATGVPSARAMSAADSASPSSASNAPARTSPTPPPRPSSGRATSSSSPARPTRWRPSPGSAESLRVRKPHT